MLETNELRRLIHERAVTGATSNPTIFAKAITTSDRYDTAIAAAGDSGIEDPQELFLLLALDDVREAAAFCCRRTPPQKASTGSSRSSARRTWLTTSPARSSRRPSSGGASIAPT